MLLKIAYLIIMGAVLKVVSQKMSDAVRQDLMTPMKELGETCGYESCPVTREGVLNVHIVPHSHGELGYTHTFHEHYTGISDDVPEKSIINWKRILDAVITELWNNEHRKFTLSEMPYLFHWWANRDGTVHRMVYQLIRQGRLHIVGGGWGMPDESCTSYHALIDQFTHSLRKLNNTFGGCGRPLVAWQADNFGHSREFANLVSMLGFDGLFINPISYEDEILRMTNRELEMLWRGSDDIGHESDIFTHKLFDGYWAPPGFCFGTTCNDTLIITSDSLFKNAEERVKDFIDSVRNRQGYSYSTNHIMIIMGKRMAYYDAPMWYNNIESLARNTLEREGGNVHIVYSTPACYVKAVHDSSPTLPIKQDDFMPITFDKTTHLTGLFTSRPTIKFMAREGHLFLQMAKQMHVLAQLPAKEKKLYDELTWVVGAFQEHSIITGNMRPHVKNYYTAKMYHGVQRSTLLLKRAFNKLRKSPPKTMYFRCAFNVSSCKNTNALRSFIVIYNPLSWPVTVPVRIPVVRHNRHIVYNPHLQTVKAVSVKMSDVVRNIPHRDTVADHEIVFIADELPPMGYRSYFIESSTLPEKKRKRSIVKKLRKTKKKKYLSRQTDQMKIDDKSMLNDEEYEEYSEKLTTPLIQFMNETYEDDDMIGPLFRVADKRGYNNEVINDEEDAKYKALFGETKPCTSREGEEVWLITEESKRNDANKFSTLNKTWGVLKNKTIEIKYESSGKDDEKESLKSENPVIVTNFAYVSPPPSTNVNSSPPTKFIYLLDDDNPILVKESLENYSPEPHDTQKHDSNSLTTHKEDLKTPRIGKDDFNSDTQNYNSTTFERTKEETANAFITTNSTSVKEGKEAMVISSEDYGILLNDTMEAAAHKVEFISPDKPGKNTDEDSDSDYGGFYRPPPPPKLEQQQQQQQEIPQREESFRRMYEVHPVRTTTTQKSKITTTTEYDPFDDPDFDEDKHYFYRVSRQKFIKNKYVKVHLDDKKQVVRVTLSNGVEVALTINMYYYASDDPEKMDRPGEKKPGPCIFKVMDPEPVLIQDYVRSVVYKTYIVEEVQYSLASWAGFVLRVYVERPLIELDWVVGPVPVADDIGKDVFIRYKTDLASGGVFYTDSNGRQTVKRVRNSRPTYKPVLNNIPSNIYPVTSKIYIEDPKKNIRFSVFNDRAQGGTSLHDGEIDLMLHRRILTDERDPINSFIPIPAPLNDTEYGQGIVVRGKHIIYISKADYKPNKIFEKKLAKEIELAPTVFASPYNAYGDNSKHIWYRENNEFKGVVKRLPAGVHVLTLQEWDNNKLLLRLENYLEKSDTVKSGVKTVFVKNIFANITITDIKETTLGGNVWVKDWIPLHWRVKDKFVKNFNEFYNGDGKVEYSNDDYRTFIDADVAKGIILFPQQIRTFVVSYEFHS